MTTSDLSAWPPVASQLQGIHVVNNISITAGGFRLCFPDSMTCVVNITQSAAIASCSTEGGGVHFIIIHVNLEFCISETIETNQYHRENIV